MSRGEGLKEGEAEEGRKEEKAKPEARGEEAVEERVVEERLYTIPLRRTLFVPRRKRAPRAIRFLRSFVERHMKAEGVLIMPEVNERIWAEGIEKPPRKIHVKVVKTEEGLIKVYLAK